MRGQAPPDPDRLNAEGLALVANRQPAAARQCYRRALALAPASLPVLGNLGNLESGQHADHACRLYLRGLAINSSVAALHLMLGTLRLRLAQDTLGRRSLLRAIELNPGYPKAHANLGLRLLELGQAGEAEEHFRHALRGETAFVAALAGRARALSQLNRSQEARLCARQALTLTPSATEALAAVGQVGFAAGDHAAARQGFARAIAVDPGPASIKARMFSVHYDPEARSEDVYALHRRWATFCGGSSEVAFANSRHRDRRLRIGYLSADLYDHPVGRNIVGLVENHDRAAFDVFFYAERAEPDSVNARLRSAATAWRSTTGLDDLAVAAAVRADSIDVLVVLAGHTARNRITVASQRAAPVQVSMHDFTTSGLDAVDWFFSDPTLTPMDCEERFSERIYRLPCFYLHMPVDDAPVSQRRGSAIAFGYCGNPVKLNDRVVAVWARILEACPTSSLLLKYRDSYSDNDLVHDIRRRFAAHGVERSRILFDKRRTGRRAHLEVVGAFDVALDSFPFNGCTTTYEALWMGVPVVTLIGRRFVGRPSASMLAQVGLDDLIARDEDAYVDIAGRLATDGARRTRLRTELRDRLRGSRLLDAGTYAREMEAAYRVMWADWCERRSTMAVQTSTSARS
jgi:predicted O-linked N-acetylglucosamine transferase (SPINDLY family)